MIKKIYIIFISAVAFYYVFIKKEAAVSNDAPARETALIKSIDTLLKGMNRKSDSLKMAINASDSEVTKNINNASNAITSLKTEVGVLKNVIKQKDNEINGLKKIITDFGTDVNDKFELFAIPPKDRK